MEWHEPSISTLSDFHVIDSSRSETPLTSLQYPVQKNNIILANTEFLVITLRDHEKFS